MAALTACLLATVAAGRPHVVAVAPVRRHDHLLSTGLLGTTVSYTQPSEVDGAIRPDTGLVIVETPANPTVELVDIAAVARAAGGVRCLWTTLSRPGSAAAGPAWGESGAALGNQVPRRPWRRDGWRCRGRVEWVGRLRQIRAVTGGLLHPLAAYELHRGLQTLPVRVRAQQATAIKVADWLSAQRRWNRSTTGLTDPAGLIGRQQSGPAPSSPSP